MTNHFSKQIITRVTLWAFIFMAEILTLDAVKVWENEIGRDAIFIGGAFLVLLATFRMGDSNLVTDFRDLCTYDIIVQCLGWWLYQHGHDMAMYYSLNYAIVALKFIRLLWPMQDKARNGLIDWPVFGIFGLCKKIKNKEMQLFLPGNTKILAYATIILIFPLIYFLRETGIKMLFAYWALIGVAIILRYFEPFLAYIDKQEKEHTTNRDKAIALAVTKEKNAELEHKNTELAQAYREKDDALQLVEKVFKTLTTAAHDLRAPLTTINQRAAILMRANETERPNAMLALHSAVAYVCEGLDHAIHQSKLTNRLTQPKIRAIFLPSLLRMLHSDWCDFAFEKRLTAFQVYPKCGCRVWVASDTWVLQRILRNLLVNAIEHSQPGQGIGMSIRQKHGRCLVRVWNTGTAIADANGPDREANFARFVARVRASGHRSSAAGHGLGLESVAQLCDVLGIKIGLYSRPKRGTVFGFALEFADAALIAETQRYAEQEDAELATVFADARRPAIFR